MGWIYTPLLVVRDSPAKQHIIAVMEHMRVSGASSAYVAGGAVRALIDGTTPGDIDVWFVSDEELQSYLNRYSGGLYKTTKVGKRYGYVIPMFENTNIPAVALLDTGKTWEDRVEGFDFTCCQAAVIWINSQLFIGHSEVFMQDALAKRLVMSTKTSYPNMFLFIRRLLKYVGTHGYEVPSDTLLEKLLQKVGDVPQDDAPEYEPKKEQCTLV